MFNQKALERNFTHTKMLRFPRFSAAIYTGDEETKDRKLPCIMEENYEIMGCGARSSYLPSTARFTTQMDLEPVENLCW